MSNSNELVSRLLSGIRMSERQNLVKMWEEANRPILAPRRRTPIPTQRRDVGQLIQYFEANLIPPLIGLLRLQEQRNSNNQYQTLGQELMKNDGL